MNNGMSLYDPLGLYKPLYATSTVTNATTTAADPSWLQSMGGLEGLQGGLALAGLGMNIYQMLDPTQSTVDEIQKMYNEEAKRLKFANEQAKGRQKDVSGAFGGGLAASTQKPQKPSVQTNAPILNKPPVKL